MTIKKEAVYTIKEAHDILGIHPKKLNRIAVKNNLHKIDNRYLFTGEFLIKYFNLTDVQESLKVSKDVQESETEINNLQDQLTEVNTELEKTQDELSQIDLLLREYKVIEVNDDTENEAGEFFTVIGLKKYLEAPAEPSPEPSPQLDLEVESLKAENEKLKSEINEYKNNTQLNLKQAIELITIEAAKQDVTHKIFTNEEFEEIIGTMALSESQIKEINYLRNRIEKQDEILMSLAKSIQERNLIEAVEKDIIDKNTHKPKKPL